MISAHPFCIALQAPRPSSVRVLTRIASERSGGSEHVETPIAPKYAIALHAASFRLFDHADLTSPARPKLPSGGRCRAIADNER